MNLWVQEPKACFVSGFLWLWRHALVEMAVYVVLEWLLHGHIIRGFADRAYLKRKTPNFFYQALMSLSLSLSTSIRSLFHVTYQVGFHVFFDVKLQVLDGSRCKSLGAHGTL